MKNVFSTRSNYIKQHKQSATPHPHPPPKDEERMNEKVEKIKAEELKFLR